MKTKIKNFQSLIVCTLTLLMVNSCSGTFSVDLTSPDSAVQLREKISKEIQNDDMIVYISLGTTSSAFTSDMGQAVVNYYEAGKTEPMAKVVSMGPGDNRTSKPNSYAFDEDDDTGKLRATGIKFSDVDFSQIHTNMAKAIAIMASDSVNMPYSGIGSYTMWLNYPDKIKHTFTLQSAGETNATTGNKGLALETTYYECEFEADAAGNVVMKNK